MRENTENVRKNIQHKNYIGTDSDLNSTIRKRELLRLLYLLSLFAALGACMVAIAFVEPTLTESQVGFLLSFGTSFAVGAPICWVIQFVKSRNNPNWPFD